MFEQSRSVRNQCWNTVEMRTPRFWQPSGRPAAAILKELRLASGWPAAAFLKEFLLKMMKFKQYPIYLAKHF